MWLMRPIKKACEGYIIPPVSERTLAWLRSELAFHKPEWAIFEEELPDLPVIDLKLPGLIAGDPE
jgi:hypothetical protein